MDKENLPVALVRTRGVRAGDTLQFEIAESGTVTVVPPSFAERVHPWNGYLRRDGPPAPTQAERDAFIREMRGDIVE